MIRDKHFGQLIPITVVFYQLLATIWRGAKKPLSDIRTKFFEICMYIYLYIYIYIHGSM